MKVVTFFWHRSDVDYHSQLPVAQPDLGSARREHGPSGRQDQQGDCWLHPGAVPLDR